MKTTAIPESISIDQAVESMIDPALIGEEETTEETLEDTSTEEDVEEHSEETEADDETSEDEESEEAEDDDEHEDDEEDSEEETAELYTVKVDGEEQQVPLNELIRGYSGQQYVQKGMREVAETTKKAQVAFNNLQNERQHVRQLVQLIESGQLATPPIEPDTALLETDPLGYIEAKTRYDEERKGFDQRIEAARKVVAEQGYADQHAHKAYQQEQDMQLKAVEPDFADPAKEAVIRKSMETVGLNVYGYSQEEIAAVVDHRAIRVLRDAARWQELQAKKPEAKKRAAKAVASKGRRKKVTSADVRKTKQRSKLKQSGSMQDAVDLLFAS